MTNIAQSLRLVRAWPLGEDGFTALYQSGRDPLSRWVVARPPADLGDRQSRRWLKRGARRIDDSNLLAWSIVDDPEIERPQQLPDAVAKRVHEEVACGALQVRQRGYKPLRRSLLEVRAGGARLFVKRMRPRLAARIADLHRVLAAEAERVAELAVAELIWSCEDSLAYAPAQGTELTRVLEGPGLGEGLRRTLRALAELHSIDLDGLNVHGRSDELDTLRRWVRLAGMAFPALRSELEDALERLVAWSCEIEPGPGVVLHRDLHAGQVLLRDRRVVLLDLDTLARGEAELDVGNLLADLDLRSLAALRTGRDPWLGCGTAGYDEVADRALEPGRLAFYRAAACLRLVCVHRLRGLAPERCRHLQDWTWTLVLDAARRPQEVVS